MAPRLRWEAPPAPSGGRRNSGRRLSCPLCRRRRRARARSSSRSRSWAAGISRPGHRGQPAVSGGGPGAQGPGAQRPGAREGRAQGEAIAERPGERGRGECGRWWGGAEGTVGSPGCAPRDWHEPAAGCPRPSGRAWVGVPGPARRGRVVSVDRGPGSDARPLPRPEHLQPHAWAGRNGGTPPAGHQRSTAGREHLEVCSKMIAFFFFEAVGP